MPDSSAVRRKSHLIATALLLTASMAHAQEPATPPPTEHPALQRPSLKDPPKARDLRKYRDEFLTVLTRHGPAPESWRDPNPLVKPDGVSEVTYTSGDLKLAAWVSAVPADGKVHPAIVFCHGGFWFSNEDWVAVQPLLDAGFVVMMPRVRGENGNPGDFELLGREVDDVNAAGRYLASVKGVNKDRLFVSGHSAGGGLAALAVMMDDTPFKLSAPIAPMLEARDAGSWMDPRHHDLVCFDPKNLHETEQRTALLFTAGLRAPIHLFLGDEDGTARTEFGLVRLAQYFGKEATLTKVRGNHSESLANAMPNLIELLNDFSPTRHLECELPLGWIAQEKPKRDGVVLSGRSAALGASVVVEQISKNRCPRGWTAADLAKATLKNSDQTPPWSELNYSPTTALDLRGRPAVFYDIIGRVEDRPQRLRRYVVESEHYFALVSCLATGDGFDDAAADFEAVAGSVAETQ